MSDTIVVSKDALENTGRNMKAAVVDGKLILVIDLAQSIGPSKTGKMEGVASTEGFTSLPAGLKGNIYIGKKAE